MNIIPQFLELLKSLIGKDAKTVTLYVSLGLNVFFVSMTSQSGSDCDARVRAMDKVYQERYNESIRSMANSYSDAIIRCEEEKRNVLLDGYRKVDSLQVRYKNLENKVNYYMSLRDGK